MNILRVDAFFVDKDGVSCLTSEAKAHINRLPCEVHTYDLKGGDSRVCTISVFRRQPSGTICLVPVSAPEWVEPAIAQLFTESGNLINSCN